ncbi:MAG: diaminopimelate epimerase [Bacteroidota bacterium]
MNLHFYKFQGNGNDFIILDNSSNNISLNTMQINKLCDRRFGIGADGLILLSPSINYDFGMVYFNSDGNVSSMCGNGGRCIAAFANLRGIVGGKMKFDAYDGVHEAIIEKELVTATEWDVSLQLADVSSVDKNDSYYFLNTGSPHYVEFVDNVLDINMAVEGKKIRISNIFKPDGTNVNFVEIGDDSVFVRTFERGVEAETLSCGTGVTASAIAVFLQTGRNKVMVNTKGGNFEISFSYDDNVFTNIWLRGPATLVFEGNITV